MKNGIKRLILLTLCAVFLAVSFFSCTSEEIVESGEVAESEESIQDSIESESDIESNTETETQTESESVTESESLTETVTESESESETETETETETEPETDTESETEVNTDMATESNTENVTETELEETIETETETLIPSEGPIKIYIDQGHNPGDFNTGASGNGLKEEELTYEIGVILASLFEGDERYEICLSRPTADTILGTDNASSLAARVEGSEAFGAHLVVSLHINAFSSETANGIEVLVYDENASGYEMGTYLLQGLLDATSLRNRGMKYRPDLHILRNSKVPTALVEMGFITNADDAALLDSHPELFAKGVYDGIIAYVESLCEDETADQPNSNS